MSAVLTLTAGFLLAVLWFDLMFDVQVLGRRPVGEPLAEQVLASIAAYYRHITTSARPMSYLVGLVMLVTMGGTLIQVFVGRGPVAIRLAALELRLPMTRFGVMKHLRVLEEAGLVVTKKRGREKLHFLNAVPIRLVHDRWVSKYAEPWAATLTGLKRRLEDKTMEKVFEIYIKTTPERLWEAITSSEMRQKYTFGVGVESDWTNGSPYQGVSPLAPAVIWDGENLEVDPPRRLVQSFRALWSEDVKREGTS